jgi:hypothetical protein
MAALSTQAINRAGLQAAYTAPSASDTFTPDSRTFYLAKVGATPTTFTFHIPSGRTHIANVGIKDLVVGPITSHDVLVGPFPADTFGDPTTGLVTVTTDQQSSVTVGVFNLAAA